MSIEKSILSYKQQIKQDIDQRKIEYLVHFTAIENIPSILKNGLCSKSL